MVLQEAKHNAIAVPTSCGAGVAHLDTSYTSHDKQLIVLVLGWDNIPSRTEPISTPFNQKRLQTSMPIPWIADVILVTTVALLN
eukprot:2844844-Amphidinium_carterae.1